MNCLCGLRNLMRVEFWVRSRMRYAEERYAHRAPRFESSSHAGVALLVYAFRRGASKRGAPDASAAGGPAPPGPSGYPLSGGAGQAPPQVPEGSGSRQAGRRDMKRGALNGHSRTSLDSRLPTGLSLRLPFGLFGSGSRRSAADDGAADARKVAKPGNSPAGFTRPTEPQGPPLDASEMLWRRGGGGQGGAPDSTGFAPEGSAAAAAAGPVLWRRGDSPVAPGGVLWTRSAEPAAADALYPSAPDAPYTNAPDGAYAGALPGASPAAGAEEGVLWTRAADAAVPDSRATRHSDALQSKSSAASTADASSAGKAAGSAAADNIEERWPDPWRIPRNPESGAVDAPERRAVESAPSPSAEQTRASAAGNAAGETRPGFDPDPDPGEPVREASALSTNGRGREPGASGGPAPERRGAGAQRLGDRGIRDGEGPKSKGPGGPRGPLRHGGDRAALLDNFEFRAQ